MSEKPPPAAGASAFPGPPATLIEAVGLVTVAEIDQQLRIVWSRRRVSDPTEVVSRINELLDKRLQLQPPLPAPYADTCRMCGGVGRIIPSNAGGTLVYLMRCPDCDVRSCPWCAAKIPDVRATHCGYCRQDTGTTPPRS